MKLKSNVPRSSIERFAPTVVFAKTLGCIAHKTDFPDSVRFPLPPLTGLISYYLGTEGLNHKLYSVILDSVCRGILWNTEMQDDMIEASRLIDESISRSINSMVIKEFYFRPRGTVEQGKNVRIAISKVDSFVSRSLLGKIIDDPEINLAIAYTSDGKLSLRRRRGISGIGPELDCSKVAAAFLEGGGHPGAAGGFLRTNIDRQGDARAVNEIAATLQKYFEKLELK